MLTNPVTYNTTQASTSPPPDLSNMSEEDLRRFRRKKFGIEEPTYSLKKDEDVRKQRAERFHVNENASEEEKRKLREKRFNSIKPNESVKMDSPDEAEIQKRKERLKRFGTSHPQSCLNYNQNNTKQKDWDSKILARQLRFGLLTKK